MFDKDKEDIVAKSNSYLIFNSILWSS